MRTKSMDKYPHRAADGSYITKCDGESALLHNNQRAIAIPGVALALKIRQNMRLIFFR